MNFPQFRDIVLWESEKNTAIAIEFNKLRIENSLFTGIFNSQSSVAAHIEKGKINRCHFEYLNQLARSSDYEKWSATVKFCDTLSKIFTRLKTLFNLQTNSFIKQLCKIFSVWPCKKILFQISHNDLLIACLEYKLTSQNSFPLKILDRESMNLLIKKITEITDKKIELTKLIIQFNFIDLDLKIIENFHNLKFDFFNPVIILEFCKFIIDRGVYQAINLIQNINNFNLDQECQFKLAEYLLKQNYFVVDKLLNEIKLFNLNGVQRFQIAKLIADRDDETGCYLCYPENLNNLCSKKQHFLELAELLATKNNLYQYLCISILNFRIKLFPPEKRLELAKCIAFRGGASHLCPQIKNFKLDKNQQLELIEYIIHYTNEKSVAELASQITFFNKKIAKPIQWFRLAKLCAKHNAEAALEILKNLKHFFLNERKNEERLELAKLIAVHSAENAANVVKFIDHFQIDNADSRGWFELAALIVSRGGKAATELIERLPYAGWSKIELENRYELAKLIAQNGTRSAILLAQKIERFQLDEASLAARLNIALLIADNGYSATFQLLQNLGAFKLDNRTILHFILNKIDDSLIDFEVIKGKILACQTLDEEIKKQILLKYMAISFCPFEKQLELVDNSESLTCILCYEEKSLVSEEKLINFKNFLAEKIPALQSLLKNAVNLNNGERISNYSLAYAALYLCISLKLKDITNLNKNKFFINTLNSILNYKPLEMRLNLIQELILIYKENQEYLTFLKEAKSKNSLLAGIVLYKFLTPETPIKKVQSILQLIDLFSENIKTNNFIDLLNAISLNPTLSVEVKFTIINYIIRYKTTNINEIINQSSVILNSFGSDKLYQCVEKKENLNDFLLNIFFEELSFYKAIHFNEEYWLKNFPETFGKFRDSHAIYVYYGKIKKLPIKERNEMFLAFGIFIDSVLSKSFYQIRYATKNNLHLNKIAEFSSTLILKWSRLSQKTVDNKKFFMPFFSTKFRKIIFNSITICSYYYLRRYFFDNQDEVELINILKLETEPDSHLLFQLNILKFFMNERKNQSKNNHSIESIINILKQQIRLLEIIKQNAPDENFKAQLGSLIKALKQKIDDFQLEEKRLHVSVTDDPADLLLISSEIADSCLNIRGEPTFNKCLLAYIMDGKNLAIVYKPKNKSCARRILRILWDPIEKRPVLFLEQLYSNINSPDIDLLIYEKAMECAEMLNLPLVGKEYTAMLYPNRLLSLDCPAPFEYVDANKEISKKKFEINRSFEID